MLLEAGSKFCDREANVPVRAVDHVRVPEPLVLRKPLANWEDGNVYVWLFKVKAPDMEAVPTTSSLVSGVESPMPRLPVTAMYALFKVPVPVAAPISQAVAAAPMFRVVTVLSSRLKVVWVEVMSPPFTATSLAVVIKPAAVIDQLLSVRDRVVVEASPMVMVLAWELLPMAMVLTAAPVLPMLIVSAEASVPMLMVPVVPEFNVKAEAVPEDMVRAPESAMLLVVKVWEPITVPVMKVPTPVLLILVVPPRVKAPAVMATLPVVAVNPDVAVIRPEMVGVAVHDVGDMVNAEPAMVVAYEALPKVMAPSPEYVVPLNVAASKFDEAEALVKKPWPA